MGRVLKVLLLSLLLQVVLTEQAGQELELEHSTPFEDSLKTAIEMSDLNLTSMTKQSLKSKLPTGTVSVKVCHPATNKCDNGDKLGDPSDGNEKLFGWVVVNSGVSCLNFSFHYREDKVCRCISPAVTSDSSLHDGINRTKGLKWRINGTQTSCNYSNKSEFHNNSEYHHILKVKLENATLDHIPVNFCSKTVIPCSPNGRVTTVNKKNITINLTVSGIPYSLTVPDHVCKCSEHSGEETPDLAMAVQSLFIEVKCNNISKTASANNQFETLRRILSSRDCGVIKGTSTTETNMGEVEDGESLIKVLTGPLEVSNANTLSGLALCVLLSVFINTCQFFCPC